MRLWIAIGDGHISHAVATLENRVYLRCKCIVILVFHVSSQCLVSGEKDLKPF